MDFSSAFDRDVDFESDGQEAYLDLRTGEVLWIFVEDEDAWMHAGLAREENKALREMVDSAPGRYLEIPGRNHGEYHELLREFLGSAWTTDERKRQRAADAYVGSIGGWKKAVRDPDIIHAYHDYCDRRLQELAEEFLQEHDIRVLWT